MNIDGRVKKWFTKKRILYVFLVVTFCYLFYGFGTQSGIYATELFILLGLHRFIFSENKYVKIIMFVLLSSYFIYGSFLSYQTNHFIKEFYEASNGQNYKKIYRDMSTSRFRTASNSFDNFINSMNALNQKLGPALKHRQDIWLLYLYPNGMKFFRYRYHAKRSNGACVEHFVLMQERAAWWLDGYSAQCNDKIFIRQGNW